MIKIIQLLLILIETGQKLVDFKDKRRFEENVEDIKKDPVSYARNKFGRMRNKSENVQDSETDA